MGSYPAWHTSLLFEERQKIGSWLTESQVSYIRAKRAQGIPRLTLARELHVSYRTIERVDKRLGRYALY